MMGKFKVGDRVRVKEHFYTGYPTGSQYNLPRGEGVISQWFPDTSIVVRYGRTFSPPVNGDCFDLVEAPYSPVRTVTRKEIVPGTYGVVSVKESYPSSASDSVANVCVPATHATHAELRAAAATFIELADALDEVA